MSERTPQDVLREADSPPVLVTAVRRLLDEYDAYRDPDGDESPDGWMDALEEVRSTMKAVAEAPDSPQREAEVTSFDLAWYSPCGYERRGLFATSSPIPSCPQCYSTAWSTLKPMVIPAPDSPPIGGRWTTERRPEDDAECERLGCEDRTHPVHHWAPDTLSEKPGLDAERLALERDQQERFKWAANERAEKAARDATNGLVIAFRRYVKAKFGTTPSEDDFRGILTEAARLAFTDSEGR